MSARDALGRGWGFPVAPDDAGRLPRAEGEAAVQRSIRLILETEPGERVMRPEFGCGLRRYLMKPNTVATRTLLRDDVVSALSRWEPRIALKAVTVEPGDDPAMVLISITWALVRTGRVDNLVYPYLLRP
ncbi:MAG: GPW/gp25 family protein [Myxococcota bacterium]